MPRGGGRRTHYHKRWANDSGRARPACLVEAPVSRLGNNADSGWEFYFQLHRKLGIPLRITWPKAPYFFFSFLRSLVRGPRPYYEVRTPATHHARAVFLEDFPRLKRPTIRRGSTRCCPRSSPVPRALAASCAAGCAAAPRRPPYPPQVPRPHPIVTFSCRRSNGRRERVLYNAHGPA